MKQLFFGIALIAVAGCGQPSSPAKDAVSTVETMSLNAASVDEIGQLRAEVTALKRELAIAKREGKPAAVVSTREIESAPEHVPVLVSSDHGASMCYKDYCPCSKPQEGMDSIICDQLEAGIDVPIETMIAGRGGREYRRQAAELGL